MSDEEEEEEDEEGGQSKGPKWPTSVFRAEGHMQFHKRRYLKAISNYDTVLEREPTNVKILIERSKCYVRLTKYDLAMKDALDALKLDKKSVGAICQKGEIEYIIGDFEFAYLTFQRGLQKRPYCEQYRLGMQKCEDAILNAIGPDSGLNITDEDIQAVENRLKIIRDEYLGGRKVSKKPPEAPFISPQTIEKSTILLGQVAKDKNCFENILQTPSCLTQSPNPMDTTVEDKSNEAIDFLTDRQNFWQLVKPLHARKQIRCVLKVPLSKFRRTQDIMMGEKILNFLELANSYLQMGDCSKCIEISTNILDLLKSGRTDIFEDRPRLMARALEILGWAEQDIQDIDLAIEFHLLERGIAEEEGLEDELLGSLVNLGQDYILAGRYKDGLEALEEALELSDLEIERAYILKNMAISHLALQNTAAAKDSAKRALEIANIIVDKHLEMETLLLLGQIEMLEGEDTEAAISYYESALELIVNINATEKLDEIKKVLENLHFRLEQEQTASRTK